MNVPVVIDAAKAGQIMESVIVKGDLDQLSPQERAKYYVRVCESIGLNPMTKPFEYIKLNGRLRLYALKDATDQLRKIYNVSVTDLIESERDGVFIVTAKVRDGTGRTDAAKGAVTLKGLSGEALANALMKTETKAKRRATLSICGLGFLDETEIEDIPAAPRVLKKDAREVFISLQQQADTAKTIESLNIWHQAAQGATLPPDWRDQINFIYQAKVTAIANGEEIPPSGEILAERWGDKQGRSLIAAAKPEPAPVVVTSTLDDQPEAGDVVWSEPDPPEWSSKWNDLGPVKQAGLLCNDPAFQKFLNETRRAICDDADSAAAIVRTHCKVKSRAEIKVSNYTGQLWLDLVAEYRAWQRDEGSPPPPAAETGAPAVPITAGAPVGIPLEEMAREAAMRGRDVFDAFYKGRSRAEQATLRGMKAELEALMPASSGVD